MAGLLRMKLQGLKANFGAGPIFGCETAEEIYPRYLSCKTETSKFPSEQPNPFFVDRCAFYNCDERPIQLFEGHMYCPLCLRDKLRLRAKLQERRQQDRALKRALTLLEIINLTQP